MNIYYHYKGFEFCTSIDNTVSAKRKYYCVISVQLPVIYDNNENRLIERACRLIDDWYKNPDNKIVISQDYTNYKDNNTLYSNYYYTNTDLHIITPLENIKEKITLEQYLKNPCKFKFFTKKRTVLKIIDTLEK